MATSLMPPGYLECDVIQEGAGNPPEDEEGDSDTRSAFQHDVDRILYSAEFRALGGKTQVVASDQLGTYHNRLTHSLKVSQIGKRMTQLLLHRAKLEYGESVIGPDIDLVEAACLLHDIGHPPFGHIGEEALCQVMTDAHGIGPHPSGFQANAQNFRIATHLSCRQSGNPVILDSSERGLSLTRATLDATLKYPWKRDITSDPERSNAVGIRHWCVYETEQNEISWIVQRDIPGGATDWDVQEFNPPTGRRREKTPLPRPIEEQIMDWADEISYACHDLEDFTKAGFVPLDDILNGSAVLRRRPRKTNPPGGNDTSNASEAEHVANYLRTYKGFTDDEIATVFSELERLLGQTTGTKRDERRNRKRYSSITSILLNYFLGPGLKLTPAIGSDYGDALVRYGAILTIPREKKLVARALKALTAAYVIDDQGLATQQAGQRRIIGDLFSAFSSEPTRLLSSYWKEELDYLERLDEKDADHGDSNPKIRIAADAIAAMTEREAVRTWRRITGIDYGQVVDLR
jgi:dGTPase